MLQNKFPSSFRKRHILIRCFICSRCSKSIFRLQSEKAAGFLQSLEKFNTLFCLRLAHILFCAAEQVSFILQKKGISLSDALSALDAAKAHLDFNQKKSLIAFLMQQSKLQKSKTLESQKYQDIDDNHHCLKMKVDLMNFHLLVPTIARLSLKLVIFYLWS